MLSFGVRAGNSNQECQACRCTADTDQELAIYCAEGVRNKGGNEQERKEK